MPIFKELLARVPGPTSQSIIKACSEIVTIKVLFAKAKQLAYNMQHSSLYKIIIGLRLRKWKIIDFFKKLKHKLSCANVVIGKFEKRKAALILSM